MKSIILFVLLLVALSSSGQTCFDAYDAMFENGSDTLNYEQFHERELLFLHKLKGCIPPDFSVTTIDGEELILSSLLGKVVVLNFWFTTCLPCLKEIPHLNKLTQQFDSDEVVFIALARDNTKELNGFFKRFGSFDYQIVPVSFEIATAFKVVAWPQSMVIDKEGKVYRSWAGMEPPAEILVKEIELTIEECSNK